jgi:Spy/CpxP family protein refolding chaperone
MKKHLLCSLLAGVLLASPSLFAQEASPGASTGSLSSGNGDAAAGNDGQRVGIWRAVIEKLDLTDAQKEQIKQIRASTPPGKDRRHQIMAVLTTAQKEQLLAMIKAYRADQ